MSIRHLDHLLAPACVAVIGASLTPDQIVSVQITHHPGWRAAVNGRDVPVSADRVGQTVVEPRCSGACSDADTLAAAADTDAHEPFYRGTTSVVAADREGWLVAVTPSGGWVPAVIAGRTGIGLSQRMQSFVLDADENPYNVLEPGKRPRATLTPGLALRDGKPWLAFAVQGGDSQDQNLLQFFLDVVEFGMTPQQATEAANMNSFQLADSFGEHAREPGRMLLDDETPRWVRSDLAQRGYRLEFRPRTAGPINAIMIDAAHGTLWGGSGNHGEDYGIGW